MPLLAADACIHVGRCPGDPDPADGTHGELFRRVLQQNHALGRSGVEAAGDNIAVDSGSGPKESVSRTDVSVLHPSKLSSLGPCKA